MSTIEKALAKQKNKTNESKSDSYQANTDSNELISSGEEALVENDIQTEASHVKTADYSSNENSLLLDIDKDQLNSRGYLIDTGTRKVIKEELRQIKRKVLNNAFGKPSKRLKHSNLIMVTSSKPNEGKTFVSINLALSIALEQDKTVLLIDADVLRPSIMRELGEEHRIGLIEYLLGEVDSISDVMYSTNIDKLKIVPAGEPHHLSNELLASERMEKLAEELAERYPDRVVIFDSPPLLGVTETPVLASLIGQGLIVVEESKSQLADIQKAAKLLNDEISLGLVINKAIRSQKDLYGYYGYGYGYNSQD